MNIIELDRKEIGTIARLWHELNTYHRDVSTHFQSQFDAMTFERRVQSLQNKTSVAVYAVVEGEQCVGYCIASVRAARGEIDSIYVQESYRGRGLGTQMMQHALAWLKKQNCQEIDVAVAEGNDPAFGFYEQFGFKRRFVLLQMKES